MKILLKKEIANLGEAGDMVEVKAGYAQNYLIPQGFASLATPSVIKQYEETLRQRAHKEAKKIEDAKALAAKIEAAVIRIVVKVSESGKIYGSVTSAHLADALQEKGIEVEKRFITVPEDIKTVGEYQASVKCYRDIVAELKFSVAAE